MKRTFMFCLGSAFNSLLIITIFVTQAQAALVTREIRGVVTGIGPSLTSEFSLGESMFASFTFDNDTPDSEPGIDYRGKYDNAATMSATVGDYIVSSDQMYITLINDFPPDGSDRFLSSSIDISNVAGDIVNGYSFSGFNFYLRNDAGDMFSSISLPVEPPDESYWDTSFFYLGFVKPIAPNTYLGERLEIGDIQISTAAVPPVPIPASILLLGTGLVGLVGSRLRKKK